MEGGSEGLCDCVGAHLRADTYDSGLDGLCDCGECDCLDCIARLFDGKVKICLLEPTPQSQKDYHKWYSIWDYTSRDCHPYTRRASKAEYYSVFHKKWLKINGQPVIPEITRNRASANDRHHYCSTLNKAQDKL